MYTNLLLKSFSAEWNVSVIIADDNTITDPIEIAKNFSNFLTSIGIKTPTTKFFTDYWEKKANSEDFIIAPTTADEISDLIQNLKSNIIVGVAVVPLKSWKYLKK